MECEFCWADIIESSLSQESEMFSKFNNYLKGLKLSTQPQFDLFLQNSLPSIRKNTKIVRKEFESIVSSIIQEILEKNNIKILSQFPPNRTINYISMIRQANPMIKTDDHINLSFLFYLGDVTKNYKNEDFPPFDPEFHKDFDIIPDSPKSLQEQYTSLQKELFELQAIKSKCYSFYFTDIQAKTDPEWKQTEEKLLQYCFSLSKEQCDEKIELFYSLLSYFANNAGFETKLRSKKIKYFVEKAKLRCSDHKIISDVLDYIVNGGQSFSDTHAQNVFEMNRDEQRKRNFPTPKKARKEKKGE